MSDRRDAPEVILRDFAADLFTGEPSPAETLERLTEAARRALKADRASCYVCGPGGRVAMVHTTEGSPGPRAMIMAAMGRRTEDMPIWRLVRSRPQALLAIGDTRRSRLIPSRLAERLESGALMAARLGHPDAGGGAQSELGHLFLSWSAPRPIHPAERRLVLAFAALAAPALENARLREARDRAMTATARAQRIGQFGAWEWDVPDGRVEYSAETYRILGLEPGTPITPELYWSLIHPEDQAAGAALAKALLAGERERHEVHQRVVRPDGTVRVVLNRGEVLEQDAEGRPVRLGGMLQDVTERVEAEARLRRSEAHLADAQRIAGLGSWTYDIPGGIVEASAEVFHLWGMPEATEASIDVFLQGVYPEDREFLRRALADAACMDRPYDLIHRVGRADGSVRTLHARGEVAVRDEEGLPTRYVGTVQDVTERVAMERQLRGARDYLASVTQSMGEGLFTIDQAGRLTYMNRAAEKMLGWASDELVGKVMHDAVHFQRADGSPYTREECRLRKARDDDEEVVRIDDDVFVRRDGTLLPVAHTSAPFTSEAGDRGWVVVVSDISERKAREEALERSVESLTWVGRIRQALAEDRFTLYAQPIVEIPGGTVVQHELLIRMVAEGGDIVEPAQFLPAAEEHGLIREIDRWVIAHAVALAGAGHAVELNLSAASLGDPALYGYFEREIMATSADHALLVVELTETALLQNEAAAQSFLERIQGLGCRVALDDFGTGFGSFHYLKNLPVDYLKIDIEFVRDLRTNPASRHVVEAIVSLARAFGQKTVAEGVEDAETLRLLGTMGVDLAQGYLISRPEPAILAFGSLTPAFNPKVEGSNPSRPIRTIADQRPPSPSPRPGLSAG